MKLTEQDAFQSVRELAKSDLPTLKHLVAARKEYEANQDFTRDSLFNLKVVLSRLYDKDKEASKILGSMDWEPNTILWAKFFDDVSSEGFGQYLGLSGKEEIPSEPITQTAPTDEKPEEEKEEEDDDEVLRATESILREDEVVPEPTHCYLVGKDYPEVLCVGFNPAGVYKLFQEGELVQDTEEKLPGDFVSQEPEEGLFAISTDETGVREGFIPLPDVTPVRTPDEFFELTGTQLESGLIIPMKSAQDIIESLKPGVSPLTILKSLTEDMDFQKGDKVYVSQSIGRAALSGTYEGLDNGYALIKDERGIVHTVLPHVVFKR